MDEGGNKLAKADIAAIKIVAPRMAKAVVDRSIQAHGAKGLSQDLPLAVSNQQAIFYAICEPNIFYVPKFLRYHCSMPGPGLGCCSWLMARMKFT